MKSLPRSFVSHCIVLSWVLWTSLNQRPNSLTSGEVHMSWRWMSSTRGPAETLFWWPRPMDDRIRLKSWQRWCCKATNRTEDIGLTSFILHIVISECVRQLNPFENCELWKFQVESSNVPCTSGDSSPIMPWTFYKIYKYNAMYLNRILHYYTLRVLYLYYIYIRLIKIITTVSMIFNQLSNISRPSHRPHEARSWTSFGQSGVGSAPLPRQSRRHRSRRRAPQRCLERFSASPGGRSAPDAYWHMALEKKNKGTWLTIGRRLSSSVELGSNTVKWSDVRRGLFVILVRGSPITTVWFEKACDKSVSLLWNRKVQT